MAGMFATFTVVTAQDRVNPHAAAVKAFQDRVTAYVDLHAKVARARPALDETADAAMIATREREVGMAIAAARKDAMLGEIVGKELEPFLAKTVRDDWAARAPRDREGLFAELPGSMKVVVNMPYPTTYPLLTAPPNLLARLPELPDELEYRFFGRHLILRDTKANIVVDALLNVLPPAS
jgi:hypothetical protein